MEICKRPMQRPESHGCFHQQSKQINVSIKEPAQVATSCAKLANGFHLANGQLDYPKKGLLGPIDASNGIP